MYLSEEHQRQRGERLCLPWDLHDDWCESRRRGAGETLYTAAIKLFFSQSEYLAIKPQRFLDLLTSFSVCSGLYLLLWRSGLLGEPERWFEGHVLQGEMLIGCKSQMWEAHWNNAPPIFLCRNRIFAVWIVQLQVFSVSYCLQGPIFYFIFFHSFTLSLSQTHCCLKEKDTTVFHSVWFCCYSSIRTGREQTILCWCRMETSSVSYKGGGSCV